MAMADEADRALVALSLHHAYAAIESLLSRAIRFFDVSEPSGPDSHWALLARAGLAIPEVRPAILSPASMRPARELMKFRYFLGHDYGADLDGPALAGLQAVARELSASLAADLDTFDEWIEQVARGWRVWRAAAAPHAGTA